MTNPVLEQAKLELQLARVKMREIHQNAKPHEWVIELAGRSYNTINGKLYPNLDPQIVSELTAKRLEKIVMNRAGDYATARTLRAFAKQCIDDLNSALKTMRDL